MVRQPSYAGRELARHFWRIQGGVLLLLVVGLGETGCSRPAELDYATSEPFQNLPEAHQQQILGELTEYFGTPAGPLLRDDSEPGAEDEPPASRVDVDRLKRGAEVYRERCAGCHGVTGDGNGPAAQYLNPRPRDYRPGVFKFTSTPYGAKPRRQDLIRTIRKGAKGTSMPAFPWISQEELQAVVDYVILLSQRGQMERNLTVEAEDYDADEPLEPELIQEVYQDIVKSWGEAATPMVVPMSAQPLMTAETVELGRKAFLSRGCAKCHGEDGRGYTQDNVGKDTWGNTVKAADLTSGMLHGGRRPLDVYRRIHSGINGTPMPGFALALAEEPETAWHLAHFVLSLVDGKRPPAPSNEISAE